MKVVLVADQLHQRVPGGIGTYTSSVLTAVKELVPLRGDMALSVFASRPRRAIPPRVLVEHFGLPYEYSRFPNPVAQRLWDRGLQLPREEMDLLYSFSMGGPRPRNSRAQLLYNVHDVAWTTHPEAFPTSGVKWHQQAFAYIEAMATKIVTVSQSSKAALISQGVAEGRIEVIPPGSDHLPPADHRGANELLGQIGVRGPFLLTVSTLEPRKNLKRLLEAFRIIRGEAQDIVDLVVVGPSGWGDTLEVPKGVKLAGFVSPEVLTALYSRAAALVYVPIEEGYGLPVLEANAACTPVVSSAIPASSEASLVVAYDDPTAIAQGVLRVLTDDRLRSSLVTSGLQRAAEMTWLRTAERHLDLFSALLEGGSR